MNFNLNEMVNIIEIKNFLQPIELDLFKILKGYNGQLNVCGYATTILTPLLKKKFSKENIMIGYALLKTEKIENVLHHYFTEINGIYVDATYGQFDESFNNQIKVDYLFNFPKIFLKLDRDDKDAFVREGNNLFGKENFFYYFGQTTVSLVKNSNAVYPPCFDEFKGKNINYTFNAIKKLEQILKI
jgi:hypothetical protein